MKQAWLMIGGPLNATVVHIKGGATTIAADLLDDAHTMMEYGRHIYCINSTAFYIGLPIGAPKPNDDEVSDLALPKLKEIGFSFDKRLF